jgi:hypothetical protein
MSALFVALVSDDQNTRSIDQRVFYVQYSICLWRQENFSSLYLCLSLLPFAFDLCTFNPPFSDLLRFPHCFFLSLFESITSDGCLFFFYFPSLFSWTEWVGQEI